MEITFSEEIIPEAAEGPIQVGTVGDSSDYIIFVPGGTVNIVDLKDVMLPLAEKYKVITFSYPNPESLKKNRKISVEDYFKIIDHFVKKEGKEPVGIIGQSFGGGIALSYSVINKGVTKVIAISPMVAEPNKNRFVLYFSIFRNLWQRSVQDPRLGLISAYIGNVVHLRRTLKVYSAIKRFDFDRYMSLVTCTSLFFIGGKDLLTDAARQLEVAHKLPNNKIIEFKDMGHFLLHIKTKEIVADIFSFIED